MQLEFRKATSEDNLEEIAELIYNTDEYIYPYWFGNVENCKRELSSLMVDDKFFFNVNNLFVAVDKSNNKIIGVTCVVDKNTDLSYDYSELRNKNKRYEFTIDNYIKGLIDEVNGVDFAYISNVCVNAEYRGKQIGKQMLMHVIDVYRKKYFKEIILDVLAHNTGAIKLYQNLGFEQISEIFEGFNGPDEEKPDVFSMRSRL